ncbi:MAG: hypothetical protein H6737_29300 [Alphaproteobacteria bacterium]|nr:hypothetical protein [Alphaproteobacteria bacterium]
MVWLLTVLGCSWFEPELSVETVQPAELRVGTEIQVVGTGFSPEIAVSLDVHGEAVPLDGFQVKGERLVEGRVPDIEAGSFDLVVSRGDDVVRFPLVVRAEVEETPCHRGYQANTQLSVPDRMAVIERFYADGKRERVETPLADIERVELQVSELDGKRCSAIVLRKTDGMALLFEDDAGDLRARAETLARFMEKDLAVLD